MTADLDQSRWTEARSLLRGVRTESAERRSRRLRTQNLMFGLGVVLACAMAGLIVVLLLDGGVEGAGEEPPRWQQIIGTAGIALAVVFVVVGPVLQARGNRRL